MRDAGWRCCALRAGLGMVVLGDLFRKVAMATAGKNFNHIVQTTKADRHQLVTSGIYRCCAGVVVLDMSCVGEVLPLMHGTAVVARQVGAASCLCRLVLLGGGHPSPAVQPAVLGTLRTSGRPLAALLPDVACRACPCCRWRMPWPPFGFSRNASQRRRPTSSNSSACSTRRTRKRCLRVGALLRVAARARVCKRSKQLGHCARVRRGARRSLCHGVPAHPCATAIPAAPGKPIRSPGGGVVRRECPTAHLMRTGRMAQRPTRSGVRWLLVTAGHNQQRGFDGSGAGERPKGRRSIRGTRSRKNQATPLFPTLSSPSPRPHWTVARFGPLVGGALDLLHGLQTNRGVSR
jgi:hypothetical protein